MDKEEAIAYFEYLMSEMDDHSDEYLAAKIALSALQDIPNSEPLTLEQLQEMEGKPVYVVDKMFPELSGWGIVRKDVCDGYQCVCFLENYGARWDAYVYPLANIDRHKWKPCKHCLPNSNPPCEADFHELTLSGKVLFYYDSDFGWEGQKVDFCPWCGRPLTEKGWKLLEERLQETKGNKQCTQD